MNRRAPLDHDLNEPDALFDWIDSLAEVIAIAWNGITAMLCSYVVLKAAIWAWVNLPPIL